MKLHPGDCHHDRKSTDYLHYSQGLTKPNPGENTSDRRGTYAVLTEAGLEMQQKMWKAYSEGIAEYFGCYLDDEELQVMQRVLKRMLAAASK
ncbi:MarR family winged helix-turn-helix transcriptional regulator [uncultured Nostoc sp.]|uniref:MarR family winged helix-turn-helix transcriptional regulator n=1 Tax=uncultured Nostoc sp. TaxID=340711 RepID=UPI0035CC3574